MTQPTHASEQEIAELEAEVQEHEPGIFRLEIWEGQRGKLVTREQLRDPFITTTIGTERTLAGRLVNAWRALRGRLEWQIFVDAPPDVVEAVMALDDEGSPVFVRTGVGEKAVARLERAKDKIERAIPMARGAP